MRMRNCFVAVWDQIVKTVEVFVDLKRALFHAPTTTSSHLKIDKKDCSYLFH